MEKRFGTVLILAPVGSDIAALNTTLSKHADIIIGRQGIPIRHRGLQVISIVFEGTTDEVGSFTGQIGRVKGIQIKSALLKPHP